MIEINDVKKEEIEILQSKLRVLLDVDKLNVDGKREIVEYTTHEKSRLITSLINVLDIKEFDKTYWEEGFESKCTIEDTLKYVGESPFYAEKDVLNSIYDEFVFVVANGNIDALLSFDVITNYLGMIAVISSYYADMPSKNELKINV